MRNKNELHSYFEWFKIIVFLSDKPQKTRQIENVLFQKIYKTI